MFGIGATLSRAQAVEFSEPYIVTSIYGVSRKDHPKVKSWDELDQEGSSSRRNSAAMLMSL